MDQSYTVLYTILIGCSNKTWYSHGHVMRIIIINIIIINITTRIMLGLSETHAKITSTSYYFNVTTTTTQKETLKRRGIQNNVQYTLCCMLLLHQRWELSHNNKRTRTLNIVGQLLQTCTESLNINHVSPTNSLSYDK